MFMRICAPLTLILILATSLGCSSGRVIATDHLFDGPPVSVRPFEDHHTIVIEAPTPGWFMRISRTERNLNHTDIFITMRRPDPGVHYAQVIVEQNMLTNVTVSSPLHVYARVVEFGQGKKKPPYRLAVKTKTAD